jgi:hypothetical protein
MATDSVTDTPATTTDTEFREIPTEGRPLLAVLAGVEVATARREAADLEDAVRRVLGGAIETGTEGSTAYLCEFALEAARALRESTGCGQCVGGIPR